MSSLLIGEPCPVCESMDMYYGDTVETTYHTQKEVTVKATICNNCGSKFYGPDTLSTLEQLA